MPDQDKFEFTNAMSSLRAKQEFNLFLILFGEDIRELADGAVIVRPGAGHPVIAANTAASAAPAAHSIVTLISRYTISFGSKLF